VGAPAVRRTARNGNSRSMNCLNSDEPHGAVGCPATLVQTSRLRGYGKGKRAQRGVLVPNAGRQLGGDGDREAPSQGHLHRAGVTSQLNSIPPFVLRHVVRLDERSSFVFLGSELPQASSNLQADPAVPT
jgi:hypothetical protein